MDETAMDPARLLVEDSAPTPLGPATSEYRFVNLFPSYADRDFTPVVLAILGRRDIIDMPGDMVRTLFALARERGCSGFLKGAPCAAIAEVDGTAWPADGSGRVRPRRGA